MRGLWDGGLAAQAWLTGADNSHSYSPELRLRSEQSEDELICVYRFKPAYVYNQVHQAQEFIAVTPPVEVKF